MFRFTLAHFHFVSVSLWNNRKHKQIVVITLLALNDKMSAEQTNTHTENSWRIWIFVLFGHYPRSFWVRCLSNGTVHFYDCTRFVTKLHLDVELLSMCVNYAQLCHIYTNSHSCIFDTMTHNELTSIDMFIDKSGKANEIRFRVNYSM